MTEHMGAAPHERDQNRKEHRNEKPRTLKNRPTAAGLSSFEMLWGYFRREVNHCGLFARIKILVAAAYDFFDHLQQIFSFCPLDYRLFHPRECASLFPVHQKLRNHV